MFVFPIELYVAQASTPSRLEISKTRSETSSAMTTASLLPVLPHQTWEEQTSSALVAFPPSSSTTTAEYSSDFPRTRSTSSPIASQSRPTSRNASSSRSPDTPSYIPSRIPRPRSKSGTPSSPPQSSFPTSPPMPSSIPISKNRSISPPIKPGRVSPELNRVDGKEGLVKNELPPFAIFNISSGQGGGLDVRPSSSRQNSSGLKGRGVEGGGRPATSAFGSGSAMRIPAGSTLGIGLPSSSSRKVSAPATPKIRSSNERNPKIHSPRSASLNMLASPSSSGSSKLTPTSSRLGVAAHFIPPETSYTPPKGVNWDEVVLPTVARKLGLGEAERVVGDEGDLAVEWDKEGTPIKWIKRTTSPRFYGNQVSQCFCCWRKG